jgi:hypothetical protein
MKEVFDVAEKFKRDLAQSDFKEPRLTQGTQVHWGRVVGGLGVVVGVAAAGLITYRAKSKSAGRRAA